ncbi:O-antigen ligase family protein [Aliiglaciecola lipolytica]|uniref:O-antigen ligase-related domain-containing protein n=1 Tax=Aliiglaciecola lipolytica E3 TaxID=1127673 RepID=K6XMK2_9ALTE|nr:O-antigen ligase family protein [Aliiglaciecola lipolytica]GAC12896.1 hypothetical protein GLIP_0242 [Aliiglaciecola lipolytica E3]
MKVSNLLTGSAFFCLLAVHLFAPWLHGAELAWEVALMSLFILLGLLTLVLAKPSFFQDFDKIRLSLWLLFIWVIYLSVYLVPIPLDLLDTISPKSAEFYRYTSSNQFGYISVSSLTSAIEYFELATLILLFIFTYRMLHNPIKLKWLVYCLVFVGVTSAIYSLLNHYTDGDFELSKAILPWGQDWKVGVRGTFSYKNQFAIYLAMLIPLILGLAFDYVKKHKDDLKNRRTFSLLIYVFTSRIMLYCSIALLLFFVLTKTDSRGGNLIFLAVLSVVVLRYVFFQSKRLKKRSLLVGVGGTFAVLMFIFLNSASFERFEKYGIQDNARSKLHSVALKVIQDFPIFGSGPGTYPLIQHNYKPASLGNNEMSKRAHSDYLETLATHGIVGTFLFSIAILLLLKIIFTGKSRNQPGLLMGCQAAILMLLVHSGFDYNVATFYLSALFFTFLAIGLKLVEPRNKTTSSYA